MQEIALANKEYGEQVLKRYLRVICLGILIPVVLYYLRLVLLMNVPSPASEPRVPPSLVLEIASNAEGTVVTGGGSFEKLFSRLPINTAVCSLVGGGLLYLAVQKDRISASFLARRPAEDREEATRLSEIESETEVAFEEGAKEQLESVKTPEMKLQTEDLGDYDELNRALSSALDQLRQKFDYSRANRLKNDIIAEANRRQLTQDSIMLEMFRTWFQSIELLEEQETVRRNRQLQTLYKRFENDPSIQNMEDVIAHLKTYPDNFRHPPRNWTTVEMIQFVREVQPEWQNREIQRLKNIQMARVQTAINRRLFEENQRNWRRWQGWYAEPVPGPSVVVSTRPPPAPEYPPPAPERPPRVASPQPQQVGLLETSITIPLSSLQRPSETPRPATPPR